MATGAPQYPIFRVAWQPGKTIDAALRRIEGAIELHVRGLREDGIRIPPPWQRAVRLRRTAKHANFHATVEVAA